MITRINPGAGPSCGSNFTVSFFVPPDFQARLFLRSRDPRFPRGVSEMLAHSLARPCSPRVSRRTPRRRRPPMCTWRPWPSAPFSCPRSRAGRWRVHSASCHSWLTLTTRPCQQHAILIVSHARVLCRLCAPLTDNRPPAPQEKSVLQNALGLSAALNASGQQFDQTSFYRCERGSGQPWRIG